MRTCSPCVADCIPFGESHANGFCDSIPNRYRPGSGYRYTDGHRDRDSHPDCDGIPIRDWDSHRDCDPDSDSHFNRDCNCYRNRNRHQRTGARFQFPSGFVQAEISLGAAGYLHLRQELEL